MTREGAGDMGEGLESPTQRPRAPDAAVRPSPLMIRQRRNPDLEPITLSQADARRTSARLAAAEAEILCLRHDLEDRTRELGRCESELHRLRRQHRQELAEERRATSRRLAEPGEDVFVDLGEQFRFDVYYRWVRRIPAAEKARRPLRGYTLGPAFVASLRELEGVDRAKVADVVVDVLTGLADTSTARQMHQLHTGSGGTDDVVRRGASTCWRVAIQRRTPSARRLHFWRSADDVELSRVVLHDDFTP